MNLNGFQISFLVAEGCGCVALIALIVYCVMERRKRKIQDAETGSSHHETKRQKVEEGSRPARKKDARLDDRSSPLRPKGIPNVGASCFMNSMLQCLSWSPCLRQQLENQIKKTHPKQGKLATTFLGVIDRTCKKKYSRRNVEIFCRELAKEKEHFNGRSQEDSFEFYNTLTSGLEEEALRNVPFQPKDEKATEMEHIMHTCDVTRLLGGMFMTCYCYTECGHVEPVFQRFTSLSLPPVVTKKRPWHQETPSFPVKPKKRRHVEIDKVSGSVHVTATGETSTSKKSKRNVDETTRIVNNPDNMRIPAKGYGSIPLSQTPGGNHERKHSDMPMSEPTSIPSETSVMVQEQFMDMSTLSKDLPKEKETHMKYLKTANRNGNAAASKEEETGLKFSKEAHQIRKVAGSKEEEPGQKFPKEAKRNGSVAGGKTDDTNDTVQNSAQSHIDKVTRNTDDQESLSECSLEDIKRLQTLCLGNKKKKSKNKRTGLELGLGKFTDFEKMMAADLPCRTCSDKKGNCGGVMYKQTHLVSLPNVLVLHINRFEQKGSQMYKVSDFVSFPKILDMTEFCSKSLKQLESEEELMHGRKYSLFGVVNHQGSMRGGHYYAYIKTHPRDVQHIQNQLRDSWRDPEAMASRIRAQLEDLWNVDRKSYVRTEKRKEQGDIGNVDSRNSDTREDVHDKKTEECRKDIRLSPKDDKEDSADQQGGPKETIACYTQGDEPVIRYQGIETDSQKNLDLHNLEEKAEANNSKDEESCSLQKEHESTNIPSQQRRPTNDVEEDGVPSPDQKEKREDAVPEAAKDDPDRMQEHKDTDRKEDMADPVYEKSKVALGEDATEGCLKKNENKDAVPKEDIDYPGLKRVINDGIREGDINDPGIKERTINPFQEEDMDHLSRSKENLDLLGQSKEDCDPLGLPKEDLDHSGLSREQKGTVCQEYNDDSSKKKKHKAKNDNKTVEVDNNQSDKKDELKDFVTKGETEDIVKAIDEKDPDQRPGEENASQTSTANNSAVRTDDENATPKRKESDIDCVKSKRKKNKKKKGKKQKDVGEDDKAKFLLQNEKQIEELDHNNAIEEQHSDANGEDGIDKERQTTDARDMWFYVSDSMVQEERENTVFASQAAYILLYERIN